MRKNLGYGAIAYFVCRASFIGITSVALITLVHQDSWISVLLAFLIGIVPLLVFLYIAKYQPDLNIFDKTDILFPRTKKIIKIFLAIAVFAITMLNFWNLTNLVVSQFLNKTPVIVVGIIFIIPIILLINKENKVIARVSLILLFMSIFLFLLSVTGLANKFSLGNLTPVLEYNPIKGVLSYLSYNILPLFILLIFPTKNVKQQMIFGYIGSFITLFFTIVFLIAVLGIDLATIFQYPEFHIFKLAFEKFVSFRLENILATQWILDIFIFTSMGLKFCNESIKTNKIYIMPVILIILNSYLFTNTTIANLLMTYVFPYLIPIPFFILPLIMCLKIKKKLKTS